MVTFPAFFVERQWDCYLKSNHLSGCSPLVRAPQGVRALFAQFLPRTFVLNMVTSSQLPQHRLEKGRNLFSCNMAFLLRFLQKHDYVLDGRTPDLALWDALVSIGFADQWVHISYKTHRVTHTEKRSTENWDEFSGSIEFQKDHLKLMYELPSYWKKTTLDTFLGKYVGRNEDYIHWGYADDLDEGW